MRLSKSLHLSHQLRTQNISPEREGGGGAGFKKKPIKTSLFF